MDPRSGLSPRDPRGGWRTCGWLPPIGLRFIGHTESMAKRFEAGENRLSTEQPQGNRLTV